MVNLRLKQNKLSVESILKQWPSEIDGHLSYCVGLSGGIDSVVLLHLLNAARKNHSFKLSAIHVNHGLSPHANQWQNFCISLCQQLDIPLQISQLQVVKQAGVGLENSARKLRYTEYQKTCAEVMILAHHRDDQIETIFSQIMRGSDVHNIASMRGLSQRNKQFYWRPLLDHSKRQLMSYATEHELVHIADESNQDNTYLRNFLRNNIIPQLLSYDASLPQKVMQSIASIQASVQLNDELAELDLVRGLKDGQIEITKFINLSPLRQQSLLAHFIRQHNLALPSTRQLQEFIRQAIAAQPDRHPKLKINDKSILIRQRNLIAIQYS